MRRSPLALPFLAAIGAAFGIAAGCNAITGASDLVVSGAGGNLGAGGASQTIASAAASQASSTTSTVASATNAAGSGGGAGDAGMDPCAGVTCSGQGTCSTKMGPAVCQCAPGYHAVGLTCVVDEKCTGATCGTCAQCDVVAGIATCSCPDNYALQGKDCKLAIDPCASANCAADQSCVPEAHCQALGACVQICDCSNCPNCSPDNSDGKWNDEQEYCGAMINTSPATMACNKPCANGEGCLPYATQICWPLEGCFSL